MKELRHAFRVFGEYRHRAKVSIFGSARTHPDDPNYQLAFRFARRAVEANYMVITGGADGIIGPNTREAIRNFQTSRGLTADGFPSASLLTRILNERQLAR